MIILLFPSYRKKKMNSTHFLPLEKMIVFDIGNADDKESNLTAIKRAHLLFGAHKQRLFSINLFFRNNVHLSSQKEKT